MAEPRYDSRRPSGPPPFERQLEVAQLAAERWYELFSYLSRISTQSGPKHDVYKFMDVDTVLAEISASIALLARLAELVPGGSGEVRRMLARAIADREPQSQAAE